MNLSYPSIKLILRTYLVIFSRGVLVTLEQPLPSGPKIIACNHANATDSFYLPFLFPEKLHFLIQANVMYFPVVGWLLKEAGQIPVDPYDKKKALECACEILQRGRTIVIFPEGRFNPHNLVLKGGTGAVRMSLANGTPIIPVGFHVPESHTVNIRTHSCGQLRQSRWQIGGRCYIKFGSPWFPSREVKSPIRLVDLHALTGRLMEMIHKLAEQASQECVQFSDSFFSRSLEIDNRLYQEES